MPKLFNVIKDVEMNIRGAFGGDIMKQVLNYLNEIRSAAWEDQAKEQERVITLCGSTRFYDDFKLASLKLTLNDWLVYSIGIDTKSDYDIKAAGDFPIDHKRLDALHRRKIDKSEAIMVIDVPLDLRPERHIYAPDGYIGESTLSEIEYALSRNKKVYSYRHTTDFANPVKLDYPNVVNNMHIIWETNGECLACKAEVAAK